MSTLAVPTEGLDFGDRPARITTRRFTDTMHALAEGLRPTRRHAPRTVGYYESSVMNRERCRL